MRYPASYWIQKLRLQSHVEGGSFAETYRSTAMIYPLPEGFSGPRNISTTIYFLLEKGQFSAFHRIRSDEGWHFYQGDPLLIFEFDPQGDLQTHLLGADPEQGQQFQCIVRAGNWFASMPAPGSEYALCGCTVAPGFDFTDFELAQCEELIRQFPQHAVLISSLTR